MNIIVDADACPSVIKEILFKAATRTQINTLLVANHYMKVAPSPFITFLQVNAGFDVADDEILKRCEKGDLVITSDIPLAADIIAKEGMALSPRGELFDKQNIRSRLNTRDFMDTMRASGVNTGGPPPMSQRERKEFAGHLDRILASNK
ncbi:YaiI/YqxD family protein [Glaciecola petra]|uniref:UPF0178 protein RM552_05220 n=1 Tax=Glaciecola petra TaxID=3075602 RepID=A0ABU2ZNN7_9ALTE|nr:YaiI/YqxD family protein [Aestuariibacter sp. P117]MDT0594237.1 YaiI/YqxD family protein [Aestuariibacter sp. P117]